MKKAKLPGLPKVATGNNALDQWVRGVAEYIEVREGNRGNASEQVVTKGDLNDLNLSGYVRRANLSDEVRNTRSFTDLSEKAEKAGMAGMAGGINAGDEVARFAADLELTEKKLLNSLRSHIQLISGPATIDGSVAARVAAQALAQANALADESDARIESIDAEVEARNLAIGVETLNRANAVADEARLRFDAVTVEAIERMDQVQQTAYAALEATLAANNISATARGDIALARSELKQDVIDGVSAEASQRLTLAAKLDTDIGATLAVVTAESVARAAGDSAEATQRGLLAAQVLGADGTATTQGLIFNESYTRAQQNLAIAQQMTLMSAGAGEQFDHSDIWYFDSGVESWSGNGAPTANAGWLRPADQATGAFVESPGLVAADGVKYNQIRLRVRKVGTPTFAGYLYWRSATDAAWETSRRVALSEPTWDAHGIGLVTTSPGWTGTVDKLRLDISNAQTATDFFEIDWVAVGRPSPGASSAQLLELERVMVDPSNSTSLASKYTALNAQVNNPTGLAAAVSTIADEYMVQADLDSSSASAQQTLLSQFGATSKTWASTTRPGFSGGVQTNPNITVVLANGVSSDRPTYKNGDLWIDSANGNALHAWMNGAWVAVTDASVLGTTAFINAWENTFANGTGSGAEALRALTAAYADGEISTASDISNVQTTLSNAIESVAREAKTLKSQSAELGGMVLTNILNGEAAKGAFTGELALAREELQTNIVVGLSAEASKRLELVAVVNTNAAALTQEQVTRATQTEAMAKDVTTLTATVGANLATLVNSYYTKANADLAVAEAQNTLVANFSTNQSYLNELEKVLATANSATVKAIRDMVASVADPITGLDAVRTDLHTEQETRATAEGGTARDFRLLRSQSEDLSELQLTNLLNGEMAKNDFKGEVALAREELQTNIVVGLSAEASKRLELLAVVNNNAALLTQEQVARATATEALAQDITTLNATVGGNQALLVNNYRTAANQDSATASAITQLQSTVGSNLAQTLVSYYTKTDVEDVIAESKTQLQAYADTAAGEVNSRVSTVETTKIGYCTISDAATDHTTKTECVAAGGTWHVGLPLATAVKQVSISDGTTTLALEQRFTAQKDTNGTLLGQYTVKIDAGGKVSGIGLSSTIPTTGGATSAFVVQADKFALMPPVTFAATTAPNAYAIGNTWFNETDKQTYRATATGGSNWVVFTPKIPFGVDTATGRVFIDGEVYINAGGNKLGALGLGVDGAPGEPGNQGARGSVTRYGSGAWSDSGAAALVGGSPVIGDTVTYSTSTSSVTRYWSGSGWVSPGVVIDGNLLVNGTVSGSAINASSSISVAGASLASGGNYYASGNFNYSNVNEAGVECYGTKVAVYAEGSGTYGVYGTCANGEGVHGQSDGAGWGVYAKGNSTYGLEGGAFKASGKTDLTGDVRVSGSINATVNITAYGSSDICLKKNITRIKKPLEKLAQLRGVMFDWRAKFIKANGGEDGYFVRKHDTGVIAQEVQAVMPEIVAARKDGTLAVKYEKLVPLLIEAVNALAEKVARLERK